MRLGKPYSSYCQSKKEIITDTSSLQAWHKINLAFQNKTCTLCFWPLPYVAETFWWFSPFHAKNLFQITLSSRCLPSRLYQGKIKPCCAAGCCFEECLYDNTCAPHSKEQNVQDETLLIPLQLESEQSIPTVLFADVLGLFVHPLPPKNKQKTAVSSPPPPPRGYFEGHNHFFLGQINTWQLTPSESKRSRSITPQAKSISLFIICHIV